jgi:hypothetical protein
MRAAVTMPLLRRERGARDSRSSAARRHGQWPAVGAGLGFFVDRRVFYIFGVTADAGKLCIPLSIIAVRASSGCGCSSTEGETEMRWEDERYVRVYVRDTPDWIALGWEAQAVFIAIMRKCDRAGLIELGKTGERSLAPMLAIPLDVVQRSIAVLLEDGCLERHGSKLVIRNFVAAQEGTMSNALRCKLYRQRVSDEIRGLTQNMSPPTQNMSAATQEMSEPTRPTTTLVENDMPYRTVPSVPLKREGFELTPEAPSRKTTKAKRPPKHSSQEQADKTIVVDAFVARFDAVKGVRPKSIGAADHAAAFELAKRYGPDEAVRIIDRAFDDPFVVNSNATLRYVASKADTFRGSALAKANGAHPAITRADEDSARNPSRRLLRLASQSKETP